MKKYKFRLQKLLDMRINQEEQSKIHFKEAQREKNIMEEKLELLKSNYKKYNSLNKKQSIIEQKIKLQYLNALNFSINTTVKELDSKIKVVEDRRKELKQKQIDRKTVEILKEKKKMSFIKEQNLIEQNLNDEFALYGFIRNHERR